MSERSSTVDEYDDLLDVLDYYENASRSPLSDQARRTGQDRPSPPARDFLPPPPASLENGPADPVSRAVEVERPEPKDPSLNVAAPIETCSGVGASPGLDILQVNDVVDVAPVVSSKVPTPAAPLGEPAVPPSDRDGSIQDWDMVGACPWSSVRIAPLDPVDLITIHPEAWASDFLRPALAEPDDLFQDKVERQVYELNLTEPERDAIRSLLLEYAQNTSRAQIMALLERGRTPREIRFISRIRMRCQGIFTDFPRADLHGIKFAAGGNETVGWRLAESLFLAGIHQRGELFRYFRGLCDYLSSVPDSDEGSRGAISMAPRHLEYPRGPKRAFAEVDQLKSARRLRQLLIGRTWPGETADVWRPIDHLRKLGWTGSSLSSRPTLHWKAGFRSYHQARLDAEMKAYDFVKEALLIESPVTLNYLQRRRKWTGTQSGGVLDAVCDLFSEGLVTKVGEDIWWTDHHRYFCLRRTWQPRLPRNLPAPSDTIESCPHSSPALSEAPALDIGCALALFAQRHSGEDLDRAWERFFTSWGLVDRGPKDRQALVNRLQKKFQKLYGKVLS